MGGYHPFSADVPKRTWIAEFRQFFRKSVLGNWQVTTTSQDVHDAFEFRRNAVNRDIESCSGLSDYQKAFYCKQSDRQLLWQEVFTSVLLRGMNRLR